MPLSEARKKANKKWSDNNLEKVQFYAPNGFNAKIQAQADKKGLSKAGYMKKLVEDDIEKDGEKNAIK